MEAGKRGRQAMHLDASTLWWLAVGALVAVELATGTFYLLMLGVGGVAAALAAHAGVPLAGQLLAAAIVGGGAVALWHRHNRRRTARVPPDRNRDLHLDVGSLVHVAEWSPDGTARVQYRGSAWDARHAGHEPPAPGEHVVRAMEGNQLVLERVRH